MSCTVYAGGNSKSVSRTIRLLKGTQTFYEMWRRIPLDDTVVLPTSIQPTERPGHHIWGHAVCTAEAVSTPYLKQGGRATFPCCLSNGVSIPALFRSGKEVSRCQGAAYISSAAWLGLSDARCTNSTRLKQSRQPRNE